MTYSTHLLIICTLLIPTYPVLAGEWRYDQAVTSEPAAPEKNNPQTQLRSSTPESYAPSNDLGSVPSNSMTMNMVRAQFGQPTNEAAPVGEPQINRWYYGAYTVYFELDRVIISVIN